MGNHYDTKAIDDKFAAYSNHFDFSYISVLNNSIIKYEIQDYLKFGLKSEQFIKIMEFI